MHTSTSVYVQCMCTGANGSVSMHLGRGGPREAGAAPPRPESSTSQSARQSCGTPPGYPRGSEAVATFVLPSQVVPLQMPLQVPLQAPSQAQAQVRL